MEIELHIDPTAEETKILVVAPAQTAETDALLKRLRQSCGVPTVTAFQGERAVLLPPEQILRFFTDGKGVSVQTARDVYTVRERLYALEERLQGLPFARISQSEIVNLKQVTAIDLSFSGTIRMTLTGGVTCYVSRRYLKRIKQALGL